jgi:hypothetical protein
MGTEIDQLVNGVVAGTISEQKYKDDIKKLARYVRPKDKEFVLNIDFDRIMRPFMQIEKDLPRQLDAIQDYVEHNLKIRSAEDVQQQMAQSEA